MKKNVLLVNGPNLNLLGTREPSVYGFTTLAELENEVTSLLEEHEIRCLAFQSNSEGTIIDWLHEHRDAQFLLFNPGAYTHTSVAIRDAIVGIDIPFIEIHISNIYKREPFRHHSYFHDIALGSVVGLGTYGYELAARFAIEHLNRHS